MSNQTEAKTSAAEKRDAQVPTPCANAACGCGPDCNCGEGCVCTPAANCAKS